ncbi:MAG: diguanylate phosphodiesterase [Acidobacteria bacterium]|nr:diguanylate phosphodiesterase [Acidobacteriota bacterium]
MSKGEDLLTILYKSQEFLIELYRGDQLAKEIIAENQNLRLQIKDLQAQLARNNKVEPSNLEQENKQLHQNLKQLESRNLSIEAEKRIFIQRYIDVEKQNEALANLYVASYQLHSTLESQKVVNTIAEIIINLIGAEEFAIFTLNEDQTELIFMGGELGDKQRHKKRISLGKDIEGQVALSKTPYRAIEGEHLISIPLEISLAAKPNSEAVNELVGVISIYKLLAHKKSFTDLDYELLNLLAGHAATALLSAKLYQGTERKLRTIEGFINLLRQN